MNAFTIIKLVLIIVAAAIFITSSITLMSTSYAEWLDYYNTAMAEKENQKYLESLPLTFEGISASLKDGVIYYENGKASVKKDDINVVAHFSEKGKWVDKILDSSEFEMEIPESFSLVGGTVIVKYLYQPEKAEGAADEPVAIIRSAELNIDLIPVTLSALKVTVNPYRVYYKESTSFDASGIELKAEFNCGDSVKLDASDISVVNGENLSIGTESVKVAYTSAGVTIEADVPITVTSAEDYNDGEIVDIRAEGKVYVLEGQSLSEAKPTVRATYRSGNRLIISSDEYVVTGNVDSASFLNKCLVNVTLKDNASVNCKTPVAVRFVAEAENAALTGGSSNTVTVGGQPVGVAEAFADGDKITFGVNISTMVKGNLSLRIANNSAKSVRISDIILIKINGRSYLVPANTILASKNTVQGYGFVDIELQSVVLNAGDNVIELLFNNVKNAELAIDSLNIETEYNDVVFSNMDDYLVNNIAAGNEPNLSSETVKGVHSITEGTYAHGICTDGSYFYVTRTNSGSDIRAVTVVKYDATTLEIVAKSPVTDAKITEDCAGITYYDGKIILFCTDGTEICIDPSFTGEWTEYTGFEFEETDGLALRDVYYNDKTERFAVLINNKITVYGKDMKAITTFNVQNEGSLSIKRMMGTKDYIYVNFTKDSVYKPTVHIYDWSGEFVGKFTAPNVFGDGLVNNAKSNTQGMTMLNDSIYFIALCWGGSTDGKGSAIVKISYPELEGVIESTLTFGESIVYSKDKSADATNTATATPTTGADGKIAVNVDKDKSQLYSMGGVSDGKYIYVSMNSANNVATVISKIDPTTNTVVAQTVTFTPGAEKIDNSRIFIFEDTLYCIIQDGSMVEINLDSFEGFGCEVKASELSFADYGVAFDATWNENAGKIAVITKDKKLHILNKDLSAYTSSISVINGSAGANAITSDDKFIYVSYISGRTILIDVYTWCGEKVDRVSVSGFALGEETTFNVQAIYTHGDQLHAAVCTWGKSYKEAFYDWTVTADTIVP